MTRTVDPDLRASLAGRRVLVYCGGSSWDAPPGTDHHLASHLSEHLPVIYVDPADSVVSQLRSGGPVSVRSAVERVDTQLFRLRPRTLPGMSRAVLREVAAARTRRAVRSLVAQLRLRVDAQVVASMDDVFLPDLTETRILYGTDDFVAGAHLMGISQQWVKRREPRQLAAATHVLAVSDVIVERWLRAGRPVGLLPNGCDAAAFAQTPTTTPAEGLDVQNPLAVVVGQLSERLDLGLLEAYADTGRPLLLVGPALGAETTVRLEALSGRHNVQWVGRVPFSALPAHLAAATVGLTPYVDDAFNRASFPLKTLEYLAAGLPVVSTDLPAAHALRTEHVSLAADAEAFVAAVIRHLDAPVDPAAVHQRQALAARHSWSVRARELLRVAGL
jgi:teichuronic acid biosynthesis glycosyltransferase TuaH